ncbi:unnamed protein product [Schistocephalus solidus]|uniref:RT_RNaseH_2 domain-containing protein n=1 Tax=Schistocephalus solidus TaxID=70667 RepID=A0A183TKG5_SCHSO|nr:unnamed protein product [Schistocephalus solidus]
MKVYMEVVDGARPAAILGQLKNEVYTVARAANCTALLTSATIFERLRSEFGRSLMPCVQAFANEPFPELEARILDNFVDGISLPEIWLQFLRDLLGSIKFSLYFARRDEAIHTACPLVQESSRNWHSDGSMTMGPSLALSCLVWLSTAHHSLTRPSAAQLSLAGLSTVSLTRELEAKALSSDPPSVFPSNGVRKFVLDIDVSDTVIGTVVSQQQPDGTESVIQYLSRTLTKAERRY